MKHLLFLLIAFTLPSKAQTSKVLEPKLENIAWIAGTWHGEAFGGITEEIWSEPSGGSMMATFKLINDGKVTFYEIEVIREVENSLILQLKHFGPDLKGWETKDETVDFPLIEITENKVVFEGMSFEKNSDNEMNVYVDIKDNGKTETVKFNYRKTLKNSKPLKQLIKVKHAKETINIDGIANETIWKNSEWHQLDQLWLGEAYTADDFKGRYKLSWTKDALYLLAEIQDDVIVDTHKDPLVAWWDDDCLEVFIDEDNSGGEHQFNHNAFAYHIALDGNVVDMSTEKTGKLYNSHIESKNITIGNTTIWEVKMSLYDNSYNDHGENTPVNLSSNKNIGFALAYCDNDSSIERENFIGSISVEGIDKNRGWIDANIFGTLQLID
ncbi:carbohydrate binding protein with CBM9 domain [Winogradskyella eximia]|uniref:Carbohydrate binding protein with CBM9 domain n=1 Tax=Winogradskyella eximia TaxID=262006 RepID=A0A3D9GZL3_9FLAO|nr:DUF6265 family protein [Winogradskyella eximia]RED42699.1 carbohydrate binding protein with CBM9 domain [Winogradskyella eximia]